MSNNTESMQNKAEGGENESKDLAEQIGKLVDQAKALQDSAAALTSKVGVEEEAIRKKALAVESDIKKLRSALASSLEKDAIDHREVEKLEEELFRARCMLSEGDVSALLPSKAQGSFLKMFLGPINVRALRNDVRLKVKEEYNNYRDRTAVLFLLFPCILLVLKNWIWDGCIPAFPVQLYQAWLLFFYTSLVLRENILRVNGSDIRPWWIYHHYCAMVMALVSLTWEIKGQPNCVQKQQGVRLFLTWAVMQGVAMLLQNRYQRQRLYTRIALGKARRMDVVWGETAGVKGQLWLLYPILFILQELPHPPFQEVDLRLGWICRQSSDGTMIPPFFRGSWAFRIVMALNCGSAGPNRNSDTVPQAGTVVAGTTVPPQFRKLLTWFRRFLKHTLACFCFGQQLFMVFQNGRWLYVESYW